LEVCGTAGLETCATKNEMRPRANGSKNLADYSVLLGFTRFYSVLLGFTRFYSVLVGFTRFWSEMAWVDASSFSFQVSAFIPFSLRLSPAAGVWSRHTVTTLTINDLHKRDPSHVTAQTVTIP
jgi:hypothetical protein